jgi:hypothetical protein
MELDFLKNFDDREHPLRSICAAWCRLIKKAIAFKKKEFQDDADDCMTFFNGTKNDFWNGTWAKSSAGYLGEDAPVPQPEFQMILMKVAEAVQLFGPSLYAQNPVVEINPMQPIEIPPETLDIFINPEQPTPDQMIYQQLVQAEQAKYKKNKGSAAVLAQIINYTLRELDAKLHSRRAIDEALIKGMGVRWTGLYQPDGAEHKLVTSEYDTVDRLLFDPDAECEEELHWVARERVMPYWEAEEKFQLEPGTLKDYASKSSTERQAFLPKTKETASKTAQTSDLICFWEIYSKMGFGDKILGVDEKIKGSFDQLGSYCYLAICDKVPWPLNLPSEMLDEWDEDEIFIRSQWPIPFWADTKSNGWPYTPLAFHRVPGKIYPMSHFKPGMGELKWLTWAMSFLANKVRTSCGTLIGVLKAAGDDLKAALKSNQDNKVVELEKMLGDDVAKIVTYLQQPPFHGDIWRVVAAVFDLWDKRVGLSELQYGMSETQDRSATTTSIKQENASVRVTDMASLVEGWSADTSRKEALAIRWMLSPEDVLPICGQLGAAVFAQNLMSSDIEAVVREYSYTVAAGSTRMQNRQTKMANLNEFMRSFGPILVQASMGVGTVEPINQVIVEWGRLTDTDVGEWMLPPPPDPSQAPPDPKVEAEMQKMQMEMQLEQQKAQMDMEKHQAEMQMKAMELQFKQAEAKQKLEFQAAEAQLKLQIAQQDAALKQQTSMMDMQVKQQVAQNDLAVQGMKASQEMQVQQVKSATEIEGARVKQQADIEGQKAKTQAGIEDQKAKTKANVAATKAKAAAKPKTPRRES